MAEELLEKIPLEKCWEITGKILTSLIVMRGEKIIAPSLGKGEGIISHIWGAERWVDINTKIFGDGGKLMFPMFKEMFNIPVKDAIGAHNLIEVAAALQQGPEWEGYYVEKTSDRVVYRKTKCTWMERYKEFDADLAFTACDKGGCLAWCEEGFKAVNPRLTFKSMKQLPRGDPYCEYAIECKEE